MKRISIITGHYGSGKTNVAVNLALKLKEQGKSVTIIDLDIVNPYFRTSDFKEMLQKNDIRLIAPVYANTNLDIPALPPEVSSIFNNDDTMVIIDVGGDDAGAIALGRYSNEIKQTDYDMFYVINERRYLTNSSDEALSLLRDIEYSSRITATKIINNTNLGRITSDDLIINSMDYAKSVSKQSGLPLLFSCIDKKLLTERLKEEMILPVDILVMADF